jgi:hypothetical protein
MLSLSSSRLSALNQQRVIWLARVTATVEQRLTLDQLEWTTVNTHTTLKQEQIDVTESPFICLTNLEMNGATGAFLRIASCRLCSVQAFFFTAHCTER